MTRNEAYNNLYRTQAVPSMSKWQMAFMAVAGASGWALLGFAIWYAWTQK